MAAGRVHVDGEKNRRYPFGRKHARGAPIVELALL
jgi:hypothetical protein